MSAQTWTIAGLLASMQKYFHGRSISSPRLDAEVLLSYVLGRDRMYLYTHFEQPLSDSELEKLRQLTRRRGAYEPVAYLIGQREFYGREFAVDAHVLIPRPETEHVVECALAWLQHTQTRAPLVCDVGTGSGAIGLTLACEVPDAQVVLTDICPQALAVAQANALALGVQDRVTCIEADLFERRDEGGAMGPFDVVVSNPPYIADGEMAQLPADVGRYEPHLALRGGKTGLTCLDRLCAELAPNLKAQAFVALELGEGQAPAVAAALAQVLPHIGSAQDLRGIERVVAGWHDATFILRAPFGAHLAAKHQEGGPKADFAGMAQPPPAEEHDMQAHLRD